ncbi:hypothetical protein R3P38DRAFT_3217058 [Favolaschia claudopus]|uniref:MACPF domain-containing protein n=1 Tax=Favolaschia claudopus TaxID=2862362 RepID=A0AAW0A6F8_9AGAR
MATQGGDGNIGNGIIIVIGAQEIGMAIEKAMHRQLSPAKGKTAKGKSPAPCVISWYFPKRFLWFFPGSAPSFALPEVDVHTDSDRRKTENITAIVFAHCDERGKSTGFPFNRNTQFLGLKDQQLFAKLWVVLPSPREFLVRNWAQLCNAGMQVADFQRTSNWADSFVRQLQSAKPPLRAQNDVAQPAAQSIPGRHQTQGNILLVGNTGHGKSKTINRLLGQNVLAVGKKTMGSTTKASRLTFRSCVEPEIDGFPKAIRRIQLYSRVKGAPSSYTLAIDDTPGFEDTTYDDREINAALLHKYAERQTLPGQVRIYPNIILVVVAWDTITPDAMNSPEHFTSAAGKAIYALSNSRLVDPNRGNVILVVTKSIPQISNLSKAKGEEYDRQWKIESQKRMNLLMEIQRAVFPGLAPWQIVFIENGGGNSVPYPYPFLPNGELSHQNLWDAIRKLVESPGPRGTRDLAGMKALEFLTGAVPWDVKEEILLSRVDVVGPPVVVDTKARIQELTDLYLGVTYNPVTKIFGRSSALKEASAQLLNPNEPATRFDRDRETLAERLEDRRDPARDRDTYTAVYVTGIKTVSKPALSQEMINIISDLPPWSPATKHLYFQFFSDYGTHIVVAIALGGTIRVTMPSLQTPGAKPSKKKAPAVPNAFNVSILREGGGSATEEVVFMLQKHFRTLAATLVASGLQALAWPNDDLRMQWVKGIDHNSTLCPDSPGTRCERLDALAGLSSQQQTHLKEAAEVYLRSSGGSTKAKKANNRSKNN